VIIRRFVHQFIFRDAAVEQTHSDSAEVKQFASLLYPECLAPVDFVDYQLVTSKA
jgi:hypothetical protein